MNDLSYPMPWMSALCAASAYIPANSFSILAGAIEIPADQYVEVGQDSLLVIL